MACKAIIVAVGIYFLEDALYFLKKSSCNLHKACAGHLNRKHKSTIVRKIGSYATWIHAPRICVALNKESEGGASVEKHHSKYSVNVKSSEGSKSSIQLENRIEELEKELIRLQMQVCNILLKTDSKEIKYCRSNDENIVSSTSSNLTPPPPPPLPPPPPPLPSFTLIHNRIPLVKVIPKCANVEKDCRSTIMEELSKRPPKLRHVERSPGGRPVRVTPTPTDPSDVLAAVLRKRFEAIHGEKQECYMLSSEVSTKSPMITGH